VLYLSIKMQLQGEMPKLKRNKEILRIIMTESKKQRVLGISHFALFTGKKIHPRMKAYTCYSNRSSQPSRQLKNKTNLSHESSLYIGTITIK